MAQDLDAMKEQLRRDAEQPLSKYGVKPRQVPPEAPAVTSALKNQKK